MRVIRCPRQAGICGELIVAQQYRHAVPRTGCHVLVLLDSDLLALTGSMLQEPESDELLTKPNFGVFYLDNLTATASAPT